jgi:ribosomal protein L18E
MVEEDSVLAWDFKAFRRLQKRDDAELTLEELAELDPNAVEVRMQKIEDE